MDKLTIQIEMAAALVNLGLATVDKIKSFFVSEGHDDEALARIALEVDQRLARRG